MSLAMQWSVYNLRIIGQCVKVSSVFVNSVANQNTMETILFNVMLSWYSLSNSDHS